MTVETDENTSPDDATAVRLYLPTDDCHCSLQTHKRSYYGFKKGISKII